MSYDFFILFMYALGFLFVLALLGIFAEVGYKLAEMFGFGNFNKLSYKLDNLYEELETGKEINVKEFLDEA